VDDVLSWGVAAAAAQAAILPDWRQQLRRTVRSGLVLDLLALHGYMNFACREFIKNGLVEFARENPQIAISTTQGPNRHPVVFGSYSTCFNATSSKISVSDMILPAGDGTTKEIDVKNKTSADVRAVFDKMRNSACGRVRDLRKPVISRNPSIQGIWTPSVKFEEFSIVPVGKQLQ
jgi:hypothetical protein